MNVLSLQTIRPRTGQAQGVVISISSSGSNCCNSKAK